ncbi:GNAT family N-acetyltransferase [Lactococcus lactis]|uniref:GNAT family N-acetyltransferase n=1 Tax=Lactococcus lactis TaxID=1358 RepID=UPI0024183FCB|nr:GNAT family N-acetyltransferase [Lactococcus lactis]MDG4967168.1 GNAT family N-acetyltransferase [Lactococcus lactis]
MIKKISFDCFHEFLENNIIEYNMSKKPILKENSGEKICYAYEKNFEYLAGISLEYYLGFMHINFLWVDEKLRGKRIGESLILVAENLAKEVGCSVIFLETFSFQAPDFYKKNGFEEFGRIENNSNNNDTLYFMKKTI